MDPSYNNNSLGNNNPGAQSSTPPIPGTQSPASSLGTPSTSPSSSGTQPLSPIRTNPTPPPNFGMTTPRGSGSGDIILQPDPPKKSKKKVIIIVVVLLALIAVAVVAIIFLMGSKSNFGSSENVDSAFAKFANYITSGDEETDFRTNDYDRYTSYSLERAIANRDEEYMEKANQLFEEVMAIEVDESITETLNLYKNDWDLIYTYSKSYLRDEDDFLSYYLANGEEATRNLMETEYQNFASLGYEDAATIAEAYLNYEEYLLDFMEAAEQAGCLENGEINEECVDGVEISEEIDEDEISTNKSEIDWDIEVVKRNFIQDLWPVAEVLNGEE